MRSMKLETIGFLSGTDKSAIEHEFLDFYQDELRDLAGRSFTLMEIGVKEGASLRMWSAWFSDATIVGLDIEPSSADVRKVANMHVRIGDAGNPQVLASIIREFGAPTVVIDDGSHHWHHQVTALQTLWPHVASGGCFIMEDLHTSFPALAEEYRGQGHISAFDYIEKLNRWVVGNRFMATEAPYDSFIANTWPSVRSIHYFRGTCIIWKKGNQAASA